MPAIIRYLRRDLWSPYVAGALLGLVVIASLWATGKVPGASGGYQHIAGYAGQALTATEQSVAEGRDPITVPKEGLEEQFVFFSFTSPKGITWQVWLLLGIFLGALASSVLSRGFRVSAMPHTGQWQSIFGPQIWKRWVLVFVGCVLLEIAAGIAGGCTSGLAISGGVQLSPAAFLFIPAMFVTGTLTALLVYRRRF